MSPSASMLHGIGRKTGAVVAQPRSYRHRHRRGRETRRQTGTWSARCRPSQDGPGEGDQQQRATQAEAEIKDEQIHLSGPPVWRNDQGAQFRQ